MNTSKPQWVSSGSSRPEECHAPNRLRYRLRIRPRLEWMEDRTLLSTFTVSNTGDAGAGSLRQAILDSNADTGQANTIDFDMPGDGVQTIAPQTELPAITVGVVIDGWSQPGFRRHAADRAEWQPGRRRQRPDDHRPGCHGPRAGRQQFQPGRRHPHHGNRRDRRLDLWGLPWHRSDGHSGRAQRFRGQD